MKNKFVKACLGIVMLVSFASCDKRIEITYDLNYEGSTPVIEKILSGKTAPIPDDPTRDGYKFTNWYTTPKTGDVLFNFAKELTQNTTLYARWDIVIPTWTVTFDLDYEGSTNIIQEITDGELPFKVATPTRESYIFLGWWLENDVPFSFDTPVTQSTTVLALWSDILHIDNINDILSSWKPGSDFPVFDTNELAAYIRDSKADTISLSFKAESSRSVFSYLDKFASWNIRKIHNSFHLQSGNNSVEAILQYNQQSHIIDITFASIKNYPTFELQHIFSTASIVTPEKGLTSGYEDVSFTNDTRFYQFTLSASSTSNITTIREQHEKAGWTNDESLAKTLPDVTYTLLDPNRRVIIALSNVDNKTQITYVPNVYNRGDTNVATTRLEMISQYDLTAIPTYIPDSKLSEIDSSTNLELTGLVLSNPRQYKVIGEIKIPYLYYTNKIPDEYRQKIMDAGFTRVSDIPHPDNSSTMWLSPIGTFQPYYLIETTRQISVGGNLFDEIYLTVLGIEETPKEFVDIYSFLEIQTGLDLDILEKFGDLNSEEFVYTVSKAILPEQSRTILPILYGYNFTYDYPSTDFYISFLTKIMSAGFQVDISKSFTLPGTTDFIVYCFKSPVSVRFQYYMYFYAHDTKGLGNISFVSC